MSHEITVRKDGTQEFFAAGSLPVWHRLGQRTERALSSSAALKMAALDWKVEERPLYTTVKGQMKLIESHKSIVRPDTGAVLGVVGKRYRPVQNAEAFEWLDELMGCRMAIYETAGSIRQGALVWAMIRLPGELRIAGTDDIVKPFILICNSHDGSLAFRALNTSVRVVCANTLTMALRSAGTDSIAVKHTDRILDRIADAQEVLGLAVNQHRLFETQINLMAQRKLNRRGFEGYLDKVLGTRPVDAAPEVGRIRQQIKANFDHDLQRIRGIEHSAWAAVNSVSQYVDWDRPSRGATLHEREERRFTSTMLGAGAELKRKAWDAALAMIGGN